MKRVGQIWSPGPSNILVPTGIFSDSSIRSKSTFLEIKGRAEAIEDLYANLGVRLPPDSGLGGMIQNAKELWESWFLDNTSGQTYEMLFMAMHLDRIAEAILPLKGEQKQVQYLRDLLSGTLDFFEREPSHAKNVFWELEIWSRLRKKTKQVFLREPPDVVVDFGDSHIGIACKKIYSERHVQNVLSEAVNQIQKEYEFGIVAVNIDDLLPAKATLNLNSSKAVAERLNQYNQEFLQKHGRHFRKYLAKARLISAIISSCIISDVPNEKPRFNNAWQWTVWTISGLPKEHQIQLDRFYDIVMN
ncbi:MAG: hypothetical protein A2Z25_18490 [Planctomycetes bacterium RBG_16_55_9]|nr:MAG: hypothetical protein A2Z25_18490 [Planctomycetes bacterium RBG_16_55_9]